MTTKNSLRRRLESAEDALEYTTGGARFVVPPSAQSETLEPQPEGEVSVDGEVVVPHYLPRRVRRRRGIPMITQRQVLLSWVFMPDEVLEKELEIRRDKDEPVPPIVEGTNTNT